MAANSTFKPTEGKREEFRRYLEKTGVMDALTKVLVSLYEEQEKPTDALTYIQNKLALQSGSETLDALKAQLTEAQEKIQALQQENNELKGGENAPEERPSAEQAPEAVASAEAAPAEQPATEEPSAEAV